MSASIKFTANALRASFPKGLYVSLHTAAPGTDGANEVSGNGYHRQRIEYVVSDAAVLRNTGVVEFEGMPDVTIRGVGIWTSPTSGDFLVGGTFPTRVMEQGDTCYFAQGAIMVGAV